MLKNFLKYPAILIFCFILSICNVSKSDQTVSEIQTMLKDQGYYIGVIDGKAGKNTIREIKNWQYLNAFDESGNLNQEQLSILRNQYYRGQILSAEEIKILKARNDRHKEVSQSQSRKTQKISKEKLKSEKISFPWQFWSILILYIVGIIIQYYDDTIQKRTNRNYYQKDNFRPTLKEYVEVAKHFSTRKVTTNGSAYYLKNYDPDYKYFIPNLFAQTRNPIKMSLIIFTGLISVIFFIQYLFFNINVSAAILYSLGGTLFMLNYNLFLIGFGASPKVSTSYFGGEENLILLTFVSGLTLHYFLFLIGFDYLLTGEKFFYFLSGIFFLLSFHGFEVFKHTPSTEKLGIIAPLLGILFAVLGIGFHLY